MVPYLHSVTFTYEVHAPQASIFVARVKRLVAQSFALGSGASNGWGIQRANTLGPVPRPDDCAGYHQGEIVGVTPPATLHSDSGMAEWY